MRLTEGHGQTAGGQWGSNRDWGSRAGAQSGETSVSPREQQPHVHTTTCLECSGRRSPRQARRGNRRPATDERGLPPRTPLDNAKDKAGPTAAPRTEGRLSEGPAANECPDLADLQRHEPMHGHGPRQGRVGKGC